MPDLSPASFDPQIPVWAGFGAAKIITMEWHSLLLPAAPVAVLTPITPDHGGLAPPVAA